MQFFYTRFALPALVAATFAFAMPTLAGSGADGGGHTVTSVNGAPSDGDGPPVNKRGCRPEECGTIG